MYSSRLKHYVPFEVREIPELKGVSALSREQIKEKEGELILRQVKPGDEVFLLDEHGREYRSLEFAEWLGMPYRNIKDWELGVSKVPDYVLRLIAYKVANEREKGKI